MTTQVSATRRYLALWFPWLPTERLARHGCAGSPDAPIVVVEAVKGALRLTATDVHGQALGLDAGLTLADARARVPGIVVQPADPVADADWLARQAEGCRRYTPSVALAPLAGIVLDITGCAHLFGGEAELVADAVDRLRRAGFRARHGRASTPEAALALAKYAVASPSDEDGAVAGLPVAALGLDPSDTLALRRAGLKLVGDVVARPLAGIAARFGEPAVTAIRRLTGEAKSPLAPRCAKIILSVERRFVEPIALTDTVLATLGDLLGEAASRLEARHAGGRRFVARLFRVDGLVRELAVETGRPTRDPAAVIRLLRERLDSLADPLDPGFGFDLVRLDIPLTEPLAFAQLRLEGGSVAETEIAALIDRLTTRMGRSRLQRFTAADTHVPEQAQFMLPAAEGDPGPRWTPAAVSEPPLRPLHMFDPPQQVEVIAEVPDGPPHRFIWRRARHDIRHAEGPERIASEWWRRKNGLGFTRDYYRIEDMRGRRYWLFRHGLYTERKTPRWYLHGLFA